MYAATHPVDWIMVDGDIISPEVSVEGRLRTVVIKPRNGLGVLWPRVEVMPGGGFTAWAPLSWISELLLMVYDRQHERDKTLRRLLARAINVRDHKRGHGHRK